MNDDGQLYHTVGVRAGGRVREGLFMAGNSVARAAGAGGACGARHIFFILIQKF